MEQTVMEMFTQAVVKFNAVLWGAPMLVLIVGISGGRGRCFG